MRTAGPRKLLVLEAGTPRVGRRAAGVSPVCARPRSEAEGHPVTDDGSCARRNQPSRHALNPLWLTRPCLGGRLRCDWLEPEGPEPGRLRAPCHRA
jgi:hypothetical protein